MYLSAHSSPHPDDASSLQRLMAEHPVGNLMIVRPTSSREGEFTWASRLGSSIHEGCGSVIESSSNGIDVADYDKKIFVGDRTPFAALLGRLSEQEKQGWERLTFRSDCRHAGASGLHDEQAWCEAAFAHDGRPEARTVYIVNVLGSSHYFGYFNFYFDTDDTYTLKSCHPLNTWASLYLPRLYSEYDVERWMFLRKEDLETFERVAAEYQRAFTLIDFPFEVFRAGGIPQTHTRCD